MKWIYLRKYCYDSTHHMPIQMSPFRALCRYNPLSFMDFLFRECRILSVGDLLQDSWIVMRTLRDNIQRAQNQHKQYVDQRRIAHSFQVGGCI